MHRLKIPSLERGTLSGAEERLTNRKKELNTVQWTDSPISIIKIWY